MNKYIICYITLVILAACSPYIPKSTVETGIKPSVFPDYTDITIPSNIAPMNFMIEEKAEKYITVLSSGTYETTIKGRKVCIPQSRWNKLTSGELIIVQVFCLKEGIWEAYTPFCMTIQDEIDPFISYRVIMPSVECYEGLSIRQRNLTSFRENTIYSNQSVQDAVNGQCINCHHYRNYTTDNMQFHARQYMGGTILVLDGELNKVNLKTDSTISAGVYPAWHPTHNYIAYSTNKTHQAVHSIDQNRVEVADEESDLILYDIDHNSVSIIENDSSQFECFPAWSPDGKTLYYVSAHYDAPFNSQRRDQVFIDSRDIRYDLYSKPFDPETRTWDKSHMLIDAAAASKSITLPRVSPDGRWLMFTIAEYGVFHIWHRDADLYLMDLKDGSIRALDEINSPEVESYHSWSSNGKWILFSTRREDGAFTRLYIAHMNDDHTFSKPFALPQRDPAFNKDFLFSYNIPEFMKEPVHISPRNFASFISSTDATSSIYEPKRGQ